MRPWLFSLIAIFCVPTLPAAPQPILSPTFERNLGQSASSVEWVVRSGAGAKMYLRATGAAIPRASQGGLQTVEMRFEGARSGAESEGEGPLESYSNYYFGRNRKNWFTGVPHFAGVRYRDVYPGIDIVYRTNGNSVEYDFEVSTGADPSKIHITFRNIDRMRIGGSGDLVLTSAGVELLLKRPKVFQRGLDIHSSYRIHPGHRVEIALASYDHKLPLTIDPVIQFASYFGGPGGDSATAVRTDSRGFLYIAGASQSQVSPTLDPFSQSGFTVLSPYIFKLSPDGSHLVFFLSLVVDDKTVSDDLAIDGEGNLLLVGDTTALQLPLVNPSDAVFQAKVQTVFATKWSADGRSVVYSTYFGGSGSDHAAGAAVDPAGNLYFAGTTTSTDLPVQNALQPTFGGGTGATVSSFPFGFQQAPVDCYVTKLSPAGSLVFSTYLGGDGDDHCSTIALSPDGGIVIAGNSTRDFPLVNALQTTPNNDFPTLAIIATPIVAKLQGDGQALTFSTFFGGGAAGSADAVTVDGSWNIYLSGYASGRTEKNIFQPQGKAGGAYAASIDSSGQNILYAVYLDSPASQQTFISQIAAGPDGSAYVTGQTSNPDFPVKNSLQDFQGDPATRRTDVFLMRLAPTGSSLVFSTFLGGNAFNGFPHIALGSDGSIYYAGSTTSTNISTVSPFQATFGGAVDIVFMKLTDDSVVAASPFTLNASALSFQFVQGGATPDAQSLTVQGPTYSAMSDSPWLTATPSAADPTILACSVDPTGLDPGVYRGTVVLNDQAGDSASILVSFRILSSAPGLDTVMPNRIAVGSPDTELTFSGAGFTSGTVVLLNGVAFAAVPKVDDSNTLRITIPASSLKNPLLYLFSVQNPQSAASALRSVQVQ